MDTANRANPMSASQANGIPNPFAQATQGQSLTIEATPEVRRGVYADIADIHTNGGTSMLDFVLVDSVDPASGARGVLASRVFMSNESILMLRDMLNDYTRDWRPDNV